MYHSVIFNYHRSLTQNHEEGKTEIIITVSEDADAQRSDILYTEAHC